MQWSFDQAGDWPNSCRCARTRHPASLPSVLENGEIVEQLSLGAGNTPKRHYDLETNLRIAEFTFIDWKGRDSARQDKLFKDFFLLAEADAQKKRCLYVNSRDSAIKCLSGGRLCKSLLGRSATTGNRFAAQYPDNMRVCEYFGKKRTVDYHHPARKRFFSFRR